MKRLDLSREKWFVIGTILLSVGLLSSRCFAGISIGEINGPFSCDSGWPPQAEIWPCWSPDGTKIALSWGDGYTAWDASFGKPNPDGTYVVIMTADGECIRGPDNPLVNDVGWDNYSFDWSPDGNWILYGASRVGPARISRISLTDGTVVSITGTANDPHRDDSMWHPHRAKWSPDGSKIAYLGGGWGGSPSYHIWLTDPEGSSHEDLTLDITGYGVTGLSWNPDGTEIVFTQGGVSGLLVLDLSTLDIDEVTPPAFDLLPGIVVWAEENSILFGANGAIYDYQLCTQTMRQLTYGPDYPGYQGPASDHLGDWHPAAGLVFSSSRDTTVRWDSNIYTAAPEPPCTASFQGLGFVSGASSSKAFGISDDGSTVVGESGNEAFYWTEETGMVSLGNGFAHNASADGSVVVGWDFSQAYYWTEETGLVGIGGCWACGAYDVSADGNVICGAYDFGEAFRWTEETGMVPIYDGGGGLGISCDGNTITGEYYIWNYPNERTSICDVGRAVSCDGSVVVGGDGGANQAFRWTQETGCVRIGDLPGGSDDSVAFGVSYDGSIIVGYGNSAIGNEAFYWTEESGVMVNLKDMLETDYGLDLTGWTLTRARGISVDGCTIAGWGRNPTGQDEAWIVTICEPVQIVDIDIKPGSCPNPLNVRSRGVLPVAILGSECFDVCDINVGTLLLEGVAPIRSNYEDVATPVIDGQECECTTEGPDDYLDLTLKFRTQEIADALGEVVNGEVFLLTLTGELFDGTSIEGEDCIRVKKPKARRQSRKVR